MFEKIYKNSIIEKPKSTLLILVTLLLSFGYFAKDFQLDASADTLLLVDILNQGHFLEVKCLMMHPAESLL